MGRVLGTTLAIAEQEQCLGPFGCVCQDAYSSGRAPTGTVANGMCRAGPHGGALVRLTAISGLLSQPVGAPIQPIPMPVLRGALWFLYPANNRLGVL